MPLDQGTRRKRRIRVIFCSVAALILLFVGWFAYNTAYALRGIQDAYAKWDTATLVIRYMDTHEGRWPTSWEDLRDTYGRISDRSAGEHFMGGHTIDELRSRIDIDWTADPRILAAARFDGRNPPFRVVWARSENITTWSASEPNELLWRYLQEHQVAATQRSALGQDDVEKPDPTPSD